MLAASESLRRSNLKQPSSSLLPAASTFRASRKAGTRASSISTVTMTPIGAADILVKALRWTARGAKARAPASSVPVLTKLLRSITRACVFVIVDGVDFINALYCGDGVPVASISTSTPRGRFTVHPQLRGG